MAIQKEKTLFNGATGNYWRITYVAADVLRLSLVGKISLFKDKAFSDSGGLPLLTKQFQFSFTKEEFLAAPNVIALTYQKILLHAASLLSYDINGQPIDPPRPRDADLAGQPIDPPRPREPDLAGGTHV